MDLKMLIIEDDFRLAEAISDYFGSKNWLADHAPDGEVALEHFATNHYQLILLDVMLPKHNGFTICRKIREISDVPIFFITARTMEEDKLNGYAQGADDYICKPFSLPILYAKAMAMVRRLRGNDPSSKLKCGDVEIDVRTREVFIHGTLCSLPPLEYDIFVFFLENIGRIFSREQLLIRFWGYDFDGNERVVDNHIKKLRKYLKNSSCNIVTIHKAGYRMEVIKA